MKTNTDTFFKSEEYFQDPHSSVDFHWWHDLSTRYHSHEYYEFCLMTDGSCLYKTENSETLLEKGDLIFIVPGKSHQILAIKSKPFTQINISITANGLAALSQTVAPSLPEHLSKYNRGKIRVNPIELEYLSFLAVNDTQRIQQKRSVWIKSWLIATFLIIENMYKTVDFTLPVWFNDIIQKMNSPENIEKRLSDLVFLKEFSPTTLGKYFRRYLGMSPNEYFVKLKIDYAALLLQETQYTTLQICEKIGFDSLSHFNHIFKKQLNCTPREYKKQYATSTPPRN